MRKNGYSGNKDRFTSSVLTALVSAKAASHCTELEIRVLQVAKDFVDLILYQAVDFHTERTRSLGKQPQNQIPGKQVFRESSAREIQSIPTLKIPRN